MGELRSVGLLLAIVVATGCAVSVEFDGAEFRCSDGVCPDGLVCNAENRCVDPNIDAGPTACSGCDALATCDMSGEEPTCVCPSGFDDSNGDGSVCTDIDECDVGVANCSADAACTNVDGGFECACNLGFEGDGVDCAPTCTRVLIFDDCAPVDANCAAIGETQFADDAAIGLGYEAAYFGPAENVMFETEFDAGNFDVLVIESSLNLIPDGVKTRALDWLASGGRIIFSYWDLDADLEFQTALGVEILATFTTPQPVVPDPNADPNLFDAIEQLDSPMLFTDPMIDDGDELAIADQGSILARFNDADGNGSIALTNEGKALTVGFLPIGLLHMGPADTDNDGKNDVTELYTNLIGTVCQRIPPAAPND